MDFSKAKWEEIPGESTPDFSKAEWSPIETEAPSTAVAGLRGAAQGLTLGFADEIAAFGKAALWDTDKRAFWDKYAANVAAERDQNRLASETSPWAYGGGDLLGSAATSIIPGAGALNAAKGAGLLAKAGSAVGRNALQAGVESYGRAEEFDAGQIAQDAVIGGALGGALEGGAAAIGAGAKVAKPVGELIELGGEAIEGGGRYVSSKADDAGRLANDFSKMQTDEAISAAKAAGEDLLGKARIAGETTGEVIQNALKNPELNQKAAEGIDYVGENLHGKRWGAYKNWEGKQVVAARDLDLQSANLFTESGISKFLKDQDVDQKDIDNILNIVRAQDGDENIVGALEELAERTGKVGIADTVNQMKIAHTAGAVDSSFSALSPSKEPLVKATLINMLEKEKKDPFAPWDAETKSIADELISRGVVSDDVIEQHRQQIANRIKQKKKELFKNQPLDPLTGGVRKAKMFHSEAVDEVVKDIDSTARRYNDQYNALGSGDVGRASKAAYQTDEMFKDRLGKKQDLLSFYKKQWLNKEFGENVSPQEYKKILTATDDQIMQIGRLAALENAYQVMKSDARFFSSPEGRHWAASAFVKPGKEVTGDLGDLGLNALIATATGGLTLGAATAGVTAAWNRARKDPKALARLHNAIKSGELTLDKKAAGIVTAAKFLAEKGKELGKKFDLDKKAEKVVNDFLAKLPEDAADKAVGAAQNLASTAATAAKVVGKGTELIGKSIKVKGKIIKVTANMLAKAEEKYGREGAQQIRRLLTNKEAANEELSDDRFSSYDEMFGSR